MLDNRWANLSSFAIGESDEQTTFFGGDYQIRPRSFPSTTHCRIDAENFDPVKKKLSADFARLGIDRGKDYLESGILALKQYYAVALLDPNNSHAISDTLDPFWHAHILFSRQYASFCEDVVGVYMHHIPLDHDATEQVNNVETLYGYTANDAMQKLFSFIDERFWPINLPRERLVCLHYGSTVDQQEIYSKEVYSRALLPKNPDGMNRAFM
jgi:hypothetical protein